VEWLTKELTPIEKVRRNVILLGALAGLLAFFPVQTEEVNLFGARFTSDVVAFGIFHALATYTLVLSVRGVVQARAMDLERATYEAELEAQEQVALLKIDELRAKAKHAEDARMKMSRDAVEAAMVELDSARARRETALSDPGSGADKAREIAIVDRRIEHAEHRLREAQAQASSAVGEAFRAPPDLTRRAAKIRARLPFSKSLSWLILVGEYVAPVVFGALAAGLLFRTQDFPMLWELALRGS
jgi:hypothetical protein